MKYVTEYIGGKYTGGYVTYPVSDEKPRLYKRDGVWWVDHVACPSLRCALDFACAKSQGRWG